MTEHDVVRKHPDPCLCKGNRAFLLLAAVMAGCWITIVAILVTVALLTRAMPLFSKLTPANSPVEYEHGIARSKGE